MEAKRPRWETPLTSSSSCSSLIMSARVKAEEIAFAVADQLDKQILPRNVGVHENIAVFGISVVWLNGEHTLLLIQISGYYSSDKHPSHCLLRDKAGQAVSLRLDMLFDQLGKISSINHVIWCDYHIRMLRWHFDAFHHFHNRKQYRCYRYCFSGRCQ